MRKRRGKWILCAAVLCAVVFGICYIYGEMHTVERETKCFTAFIAMAGEGNSKGSRLKTKIAEITGAYAELEWLSGQAAEEKIQGMIRRGEYPDFINGSDAESLLLDAGALVPLDDYLDSYPNLKNYLKPAQWDSLRKEDGHIYFIPPFGVIQGHSSLTINSGEAFWVQKRVLEWAGYPKLKTLDDYFDLILAYLKENPQTDGEDNIGFEILCDDWKYYCLENPPMFLAGYPNDGCAIVDPVTQTASVYDTIPEAEQYYRKLCEMYQEGVIDPETFTLSYSQYVERLSAGNVLGFVDQYWNIMSVQDSLYAEGAEDRTYVPFAITANEDIEGSYNCAENSLNVSSGMGISVDCEDVEGALQFMNDLLSPEVMILRYWGEEGIDYEVDQDGLFYRTEEQRTLWADEDFLKETGNDYSWFPGYSGMLADGINTVLPADQPGEYYAQLSDYDRNILDAYGYQTWKEFLGEDKEGEPWFPLYSAKADWTEDSEYGKALSDMERIKRRWLPLVIMSGENKFDETWAAYMQDYRENVNVEAYENQLNLEIQKRVRNSGIQKK